MNQGRKHYNYSRLVLFLSGLVLLGSVTAAEISKSLESSESSQDRLKVGLALGGGGARGYSHIGVLRALEEHNIQVDCVVGTSMGSVIGGLYASGNTPDEIEQIISDMDWSFASTDGTSRDNESIRVKERELKIAHSGKLGVSGTELGLPLGALSGQNLKQVLSRINLETLVVRNFDEFPRPFRAVATDLVTGKEYVIGSGSMSEAMRASMAVPGILDPVEIDNKLLVDGGIANNVPVSVARELCGDIVIAVSVGAELESKEEMTSLLAITEQITSILTWGNTNAAIESLTENDLLIQPELGDIGSASFSIGLKGVPLGYAAAKMALSTWKNTEKLASSESLPTDTVVSAPVIAFVELVNESPLADEKVLAKLNIQTGKPLNLNLLNRDINQLYGLGLFDSVSWDYIKNYRGETGVKVVAYQNPAKRNYMQFGLQLEHDSSSDSNFTLSMAYLRSSINKRGGNIRLAGSLGENSGLSFDYYQPIDMQDRYFINPIAKYQRRELNLFSAEQNVSELELHTTGIYLGTGINFGSKGELRIGYERADGDIDILSGAQANTSVTDFDLGEVSFRGVYDNLDSYFFPRSGSRFSYGMRVASDNLGASAEYEQIAFSGIGARSWGKGTLAWTVHAGYSIEDTVPVERAFELGGLGQLSGLATNQLVGQHLGFASLTWYRYLAGIKQISAFAGVSMEVGNVWQQKENIGFDNLRKAGSIFVGADSPIGQLYLGLGFADGGDSALYLYVGNPFDFSDGLLGPR